MMRNISEPSDDLQFRPRESKVGGQPAWSAGMVIGRLAHREFPSIFLH